MKITDNTPIEYISADQVRDGLLPFLNDLFKRFGPDPSCELSVFCLSIGQDISQNSMASLVFSVDQYPDVQSNLIPAQIDLKSKNPLYLTTFKDFSANGQEQWGHNPFPDLDEHPDMHKFRLYNQAIWLACEDLNPTPNSNLIIKMPEPIIAADQVLFIIYHFNISWLNHYTGCLNSHITINEKSFFNQTLQAINDFLRTRKWTKMMGAIEQPSYKPHSKATSFYEMDQSVFDAIFEMAAGSFIAENMPSMHTLPGYGMLYGMSVPDKKQGMETLYNIKKIAAHKYEKKECKAEIQLVNDISGIKFKPCLVTKPHLSEHRKIRKLLEATGSDRQLIAYKGDIHGMSLFQPHSPDLGSPNDITIKFLSFMTWELYHNGQRIFIFKEGEIIPTYRGLLAENASQVAQKVLAILPQSNIDYELKMMVLGIPSMGHGGIIVITDHPEKEVARLAEGCFPTNPFKIKPEELTSLTAMDGALLFGSDLRCHAIGVVLDGIADNQKADSSRGSRYNSAHRYYNYRKNYINLMVIVVSDDGMIEIIPNL